ncbi:hypothetical protein Tco_0984785 [Tanacetum coccineum]
MDSEATDASTQQNPEQMDEEFTTTAYPNVQENLKLPTEDQVIIEEPASSTGTTSHSSDNTSSTNEPLRYRLSVSHPVSTMIHAPLPTSTTTVTATTTTTSLPPPPPQP